MKKNERSLFCLLAAALVLTGCGEPELSRQENATASSWEPPVPTSLPTPELTEHSDTETVAEPEDSRIRYVFDPNTTYQTMDGFGAAYTWYANWVNYTDDPDEVMDALFSDAKLTVLRFKNEYEYERENDAPNVYTMVQYYAAARERAAEYGEDVKVLLCCWSPPAYLKEGSDITGSATLRKTDNGQYCYAEYAAWWAQAIAFYRDYGIEVDYICIQNEVEFAAEYDGCVFAPRETEEKASFAKAYLAVYDELQRQFGENAPQMLGPETMSCRLMDIQPYMKEILESRPETVYGIAHHLYVGGDASNEDNTMDPGSFTSPFMSLRNHYSGLARWQTEYYVGHALDTATLINNALIFEDLNCYLYWSGVWDDSTPEFESGYLIGVKNWNSSAWNRKADYYALRHFSQFIRPGYLRMEARSQNLAVNTSGFISPDGNKAVLVLINNGAEELSYRLAPSHYTVESAIVYQSVFGETCSSEEGLYQNLGNLGPEGTLILPASSVTTVDITGRIE